MPSSVEPNFVYAVTPFTMLDYPGKPACIIWLAGCNLRCGYCHNPEMVTGRGQHAWSTVMEFLKMRQGKLQGVVFSGGEATTCPLLPEMCRDVRSLGYAVKVDTNGTRPAMVARLVEEGLVDFIALDYKAPPHRYKKVTGTERYDSFSKTLNYLLGTPVPLYLRTTVHPSLLNEEDVEWMKCDLKERGYQGELHIQQARTHTPTLGNLA